MAGNAPAGGGKDQTEFAFRAGEFPLPQRLEYQRPERHGAVTGFRFRLAYYFVAVRPLADVQFGALEVDVLPAQSAQF